MVARFHPFCRRRNSLPAAANFFSLISRGEDRLFTVLRRLVFSRSRQKIYRLRNKQTGDRRTEHLNLRFVSLDFFLPYSTCVRSELLHAVTTITMIDVTFQLFRPDQSTSAIDAPANVYVSSMINFGLRNGILSAELEERDGKKGVGGDVRGSRLNLAGGVHGHRGGRLASSAGSTGWQAWRARLRGVD